MSNKHQRQLKRLLNEIEESLPPPKRPLVGNLRHICVVVRHELSGLKRQVRTNGTSHITPPTPANRCVMHEQQILALQNQLALAQKDLATEKQERQTMQRTLENARQTSKIAQAQQRSREGAVGEWFFGFDVQSDKQCVVHLRYPKFVVCVPPDIEEVPRIASKLARNCGNLLVPLRDFVPKVLGKVRWLDEEPSPPDAEALTVRAVAVVLTEAANLCAEEFPMEDDEVALFCQDYGFLPTD